MNPAVHSGPLRGGRRESFSKETWIQRDICERTPFPFAEKEIDLVICSHSLEGVRNPLWVCAEMIRVAKQGYLEVPSRVAESCRGVETARVGSARVGWSHHRWLIDIEGNRVRFLMKYHMIQGHWRFSFPHSYWRRLPESQRVKWLFWEDRFDCSEALIHGAQNVAAELERFVQRSHPYPRWRVMLDRGLRGVGELPGLVVGKVRRGLQFRSQARCRSVGRDDQPTPREGGN